MNSLLSVRRNDSCIICGNGPSVLCKEVFLDTNDIFLLNTGIFLNVSPTLYFYERIGLLSGNTSHNHGIDNYLHLNFDFEAVLRIILYEMGRTAARVVGQQRIVVNPNQASLGYLNAIPEIGDGIDCKYFSFNEEEIDAYGTNLIRYFRDFYPSYVLNFRGSVIRAFSVALSLGYKRICFAGVDPSEYTWWWETESSEMVLRSGVRHLRDHFNAIRLLRPAHLTKYDSEIGPWQQAPMSWCLRKTILAAKRVYTERSKEFPEIRLIGSDPIAKTIFSGIC